MVKRAQSDSTTVLAAVNADFFELKSGENENNQVMRGEWWKGLKVTDSPYDTYDNVHIQFGLDAARRPLMDRFILDGRRGGARHDHADHHGEFQSGRESGGHGAVHVALWRDDAARHVASNRRSSARVDRKPRRHAAVRAARRRLDRIGLGDSTGRRGARGVWAWITHERSTGDGGGRHGQSRSHDTAASAARRSADAAHRRLAAHSARRQERRIRRADGRRNDLAERRNEASAHGHRLFARQHDALHPRRGWTFARRASA